jgi:hypothetical protein
MIAEIAKKGPEGEEFARSYNKKFNEMHLDRFLSREEYIEARDKMRESIETRFVIDKAGEFLDHIDKEENFLEAFSKKDFEEQRKDLLYVWGGKGKIKFYESLKERFDAENPSKEDTKDKRHPRQIFNDIVKKRMVKAIAQNGEQGELFAANYRSMMELHDLNSSVNLTVEQYLTAKEEMQKFISDYRVEETKAGPDPRGEEKKQARGETLDEKKKNSEMEKIENQTSPSRVPAPTNKTTTLAEKGKNHGKPALPGT